MTTCPTCGNPMPALNSKRQPRKFCSPPCTGRANSQLGPHSKAREKPPQRGGEPVLPGSTPLSTPSQCAIGPAHRWRIETPAGPTSLGMCQHCGAERTFANSYDATVEAELRRQPQALMRSEVGPAW
jgi:hypothetical protein